MQLRVHRLASRLIPRSQVNTTTCARGRNAPKTAVIGIGYLTDYGGLGKARNLHV